MPMPHLRDARGFTLADACVILIAVGVLSSILMTNIGGYVRLTQLTRAKHDLDELCDALADYILDIGDVALRERRVLVVASSSTGDEVGDHREPVGLLMGRGAVPIFIVDGLGDGAGLWTRHPGDGFELFDDMHRAEVRFAVDTFGRHLGGPARTTAAATSDARFAWRGPYLDEPVEADPWGQRYMANVFGLYAADDDGEFGSEVVCYSAGPDGEIDTGFNQPVAWATGDDDLAVNLAGGGMN